MKTGIAYVSAVVAAALLLSVAVAALQQAPAGGEKPPVVIARGTVDLPPLPPGGSAPRMADGHVDLTGVWFAGNIGRASAWSVDRDRGGGSDEPVVHPAHEKEMRVAERPRRTGSAGSTS